MTLDEAITRSRILSSPDNESSELALQMLNWLIELKNFKEEEKQKIKLFENMIIEKDLEIRDLKRKLAKYEVPGIER